MPVTLHIPTALRSFTEGQSSLVTEATTVAQALESLVNLYPELRKHLFNDNGVLRSFVNVYVGEDNIRHRDGVSTPITDGQEIMIVPAIAGGSHHV